MASASTTVYSHVVKTEGVRGGKACIDDTRIAVADIVNSFQMGQSPEQIAEEVYPDLSLAQVHAALAYYYDNREEIEANLVSDDDAEEEYERERADYLSRHAPK